MLAETLLIVLLSIIYWFINLRPRSPFNVCPVLCQVKPVEVDYVVVGAGPGGLGAARALLEGDRTATILLIERGPETLPRSTLGKYMHLADRSRALLCSPESVYSPMMGGPLDQRLVARRPLRSLAADLEDDSRAMGRELLAYTPFPRMIGVGGGSLADWGLHLPSIVGSSQSSRWVESRVTCSENRNPLSWAFGVSAAEEFGESSLVEGATVSQPFLREAVWQALLRVDVDGKRTPLLPAVLTTLRSAVANRLSIYTDACLVDVKTTGDSEAEEGARVHSVIISFKKDRRVELRVRRGVILAGGVVHTPRMLYTMFGRSHPFPRHMATVRDCLALPVMFQSKKGISADACNVEGVSSSLRWLLAQRGPILQPIADTIFSLPLPELGPEAEMLAFMMPAGGRDPHRYDRLGWSRTLGSFAEAAAVLLVLNGVEGLEHTIDLDEEDELQPASSCYEGLTKELMKKRQTLLTRRRADTEFLSQDARRHVLEAFQRGIRKCRAVAGIQPLSSLLTGLEGVDCTLLDSDPDRALQLAKLMHTPPKRLTKQQQHTYATLLAWSQKELKTDDYMNRYISEHAYWLGFASGSAEPFLKSDGRVQGYRNVVVGDCSACTRSLWEQGRRNTMAAGGISTAVDMGRIAAERLLDEGRASAQMCTL